MTYKLPKFTRHGKPMSEKDLVRCYNPFDKDTLTGQDKENYYNLQAYDPNHAKADDLGFIHFKDRMSQKIWEALKLAERGITR